MELASIVIIPRVSACATPEERRIEEGIVTTVDLFRTIEVNPNYTFFECRIILSGIKLCFAFKFCSSTIYYSYNVGISSTTYAHQYYSKKSLFVYYSNWIVQIWINVTNKFIWRSQAQIYIDNSIARARSNQHSTLVVVLLVLVFYNFRNSTADIPPRKQKEPSFSWSPLMLFTNMY